MKLKKVVEAAHRLSKPSRVNEGKDFRLKDVDPKDTRELKSEDKPQSKAMLQVGIEALTKLQDVLYAQDRWSVLLIFQAMDAAGNRGSRDRRGGFARSRISEGQRGEETGTQGSPGGVAGKRVSADVADGLARQGRDIIPAVRWLQGDEGLSFRVDFASGETLAGLPSDARHGAIETS